MKAKQVNLFLQNVTFGNSTKEWWISAQTDGAITGRKWAGERCLSKQGNTSSLSNVYKAEREEHHPSVSSGCAPRHVTPSGHPMRTPTHMRPQPAQTNRGIKRGIAWKRGTTHLINLPGTFHSTAVGFTGKFTFTRRWKWLIPKMQSVQRQPQVIIYTVCSMHAILFSELYHALCIAHVS